jgi:hypothetical protein
VTLVPSGRVLAGWAAASLLASVASAAEPPLPRPRPNPPIVETPAAPSPSIAEAAAERAAPATLSPTEARLPRPRPGIAPNEAAAPATEQAGQLAAPGEAHPPERLGALPAPAAAPPGAFDAVAAIDVFARLPKPRPLAPAALALLEPGTSEALDEAPMMPSPVELGIDISACLKRLQNLGVEFTRLAPMASGGACHVAAPLDVTSLGSGVALTPQAILNCRTAEGLALWVRDSLVPASKKYLGAVPNKVVHDSTYVCRARNNAPGGRLSEHATANAVDIASIGFADRPPVAIGRGSAASEKIFELAIRRESCAFFTTVLGPGSNAAHATHFHFDAAQRRGGYRLCDPGASAAGRRR